MEVSTLLLLLSSMEAGGRKRKGFLLTASCCSAGERRLVSLSAIVFLLHPASTNVNRIAKKNFLKKKIIWMQFNSIDLASLSLLPEVWRGNLMAVVLAGVEECRERGRPALLGIERLTVGRDLSASFRSNFGMENGTGDI